MTNYPYLYIDGQWVFPINPGISTDIINPSNGNRVARVALGGTDDARLAIAAAKKAFPGWSQSSREQRLALLEALLDSYRRHADDLAQALTAEMGAPVSMALSDQVGSGAAHLQTMIDTLKCYEFSRAKGPTRIVHEPVGVVAMITPWNWPLNQITCKVAPALAAGCTMVLKPSEIAPVSALIFTEALHQAGVPAGVFNLVNGDGPGVGEILAAHPDVDMVSITGSTRAGVRVATLAAPTVKRVHQELGGKSANIILDDAELEPAVTRGLHECFYNSGQSCNAPTRMLIPVARLSEAAAIARRAAESLITGPADHPRTDLGPVVGEAHFNRIQAYIRQGIAEGATVVTGGPGKPDDLAQGFYVKPTVFTDVTPEMTIAREEIFGPVLCLMGYQDENNAVEIANDSPYGLAAYIQSSNPERARRVAGQLRVGTVYINYPDWDSCIPFGGFRQSGNGREYAEFGLEDYLEIKGIVG